MKKLNILDVSPMGVYPPKCGGSSRIHNLNLELSWHNNIFLFSQGIRLYELKFPIKSWLSKINDNYIEYRYVNNFNLLSYLFIKFNMPGRSIIHEIILRMHTPKILKNKINKCDIIQVEFSWQFKYLYDI